MNTDSNTVLVVDDDPSNMEQIVLALKGECRVRAASDAGAALKAVMLPPLPNLVLLDIMMPGMDGYALCRHLKSDPRTAEIPVIFLTAKSDVEDEAHGFREGAVDYIHKPISPPILQARVRTHLALKHSHDLLRKQNETLEELVRQRTEELARALARALAAGKAKTAFLQTMSHELRTPLNHILGYAEILEEELAGDSGLLADLGRIRTSGRHLLEMIDRVLEYARNEGAEDIETQEVRISEIARRAGQDCADLVHGNKNHLEIDVPQDMIASTDPVRLQNVLTELIRNAAKFTSNGRISVSAQLVTGSEAHRIAVNVSDTGIGMSDEQVKHCFDPFWQADASITRTYGGAGMGLASVKQIARQIGAELSVTSSPGKGSTVRLLL